MGASQKPILIAGPTASGKSSLAMDLADSRPSVIINADALQVYDGWRVLTARPSPEDEDAVAHELYGHVSMTAAYSAGHWLRDVARALATATQKNLRPIIVGGTGLYFTALTQGLAEIPPVAADVRQAANELRENRGLAALIGDLKTGDPEIVERIDLTNPMRVQRAWEVLKATGRPLSAWQRDTGPPLIALHDCIPCVLMPDTEWLNARIAKRFSQMVDEGALDEVRTHLEAGLDPALPSMQALGARDLAVYLDGDAELSAALEKGAVATRRYAKKQRTWFRSRMKHWNRIGIPGTDPLDEVQALTTADARPLGVG